MIKVSFSPFADGQGHDYRALLCSSERATLTVAIHGFTQDALASQVRPVLGTSTAAHLGWFVADELRFSGGYWAVGREDDAACDGRSGYRVDTLEDLWGEFSRDREQLWSFRELTPSIQGVFFFDVSIRGRAQEKTLCGTVAGHMVVGFGEGGLVCWGEHEPLASVWNRTELIGPLQAQIPTSRRYLARGERGEPVSAQVSRTRIGLPEHIRGLVPTGEYGRPDGLAEGVPLVIHPAIAKAFKGLADGFRPNLVMTSYGEMIDQDGSPGQITPKRRVDTPLAVLIGVSAVRDLGIDVADLSVNHDVAPLGLKQIPNLLVRFSDGDELWYQLVTSTHDLDQEHLAAVLAVEFGDMKPGEEMRG